MELKMNRLPQTVAVVRSFTNPALVKQLKALRAFLPYVIVVTDNARDKGTTRAMIEKMNDPNIDLIEMNEGYTWSNALNRALHHIHLVNASKPNKFEYIFNVSVEARFTKDHLKAMLAEFATSDVGVVGTSFRGLQEGNVISLGNTYRHPRNTGMIVRLDVFAQPMVSLGFDPFCDNVGGMEDIDFIYRMAMFTGYVTKMVSLSVDLIVGKHYDQDQKEEREADAMEKIFARYSRWHKTLTESVQGGWLPAKN